MSYERCLHVQNAMIKRSNVLCCTFCEDARPYTFVQLATFIKLQLANYESVPRYSVVCVRFYWTKKLAALVADGAVQTAVKLSWR